ncbi:hypothetical protein ACEWY4_010003 [Coilia grayii]|uniref:NACHT domain-containing protein n=1 Tax=Coilia grayii TaxID=363190 RepID=A0ABD1K853_9TELE
MDELAEETKKGANATDGVALSQETSVSHLTATSGAVVNVQPEVQKNNIGRDLYIVTNISNTCDQYSITENYNDIIQRYEYVKEYNVILGENLLFKKRYTDLLIIQKQRDQSEKKKEICSKGETFQDYLRDIEYEKDKYHITSVDQLFCPEDDGKTPKATVLQGNSGSGKSYTARWIMLRWAQQELYTESFQFIFYLDCKEFSGTSDHITLVELLHYNQSLTQEQILWILKNASKRILFLIDAFDELRPLKSKTTIISLHTSATPEDIICALLSGRLLRESFLLVTTRSMAADRLGKLLKHPQRFTEIMGFSEEGVEKYFEKFFEGKQVSHTQAFDRVKINETLYTACSIPVICWIVCTVLSEAEEAEEEDEDTTRDLETTASIYVHFMLTMREHHSEGLDGSIQSVMRSLSELADEGTKNQQVFFDKKLVPKEISDPANVPFLCKFLLKRVRLVTMFSFVHLSLQEFFASLHYTFMEKEELQEDVGKMLDSLKIHQDLHLLPVILFLFGLSNDNVSDLLSDTCDLSSFACVRTFLEEWLLKALPRARKSPDGQRIEMFLLQCLYELHDRGFARKAVESWGKVVLHSNPLRRPDCWALRYCFQCCPRIPSLSIRGCFITADKMRMLQPILRKCDELMLMVEDLSDNDVKDLILCLDEQTDLKELRVDDSTLSEQSLREILDAVGKQKSVGRLEISVQTVTTGTAVLLTDFMKNKDAKMLLVTDNDDKSLYSSVSMSRKDDDIICPEFEKRLDALQSALCSIMGLRHLELRVKSLTSTWASRALTLLQNSGSSFYISLEENKAGPINAEALYSSLTVLIKDGHFTLSVGEYVTHEVLKRQSPQTRAPLSEIVLTCPRSELSTANWKNLLHIYDNIKSFSEECEGFDEQCAALMSFLSCVPGLKELNLKVMCVTERWASRGFSLMHSCPGLQHLGIVTDGELLRRDGVEEGLCVSLSMANSNGDFMLSIEGRAVATGGLLGFSCAKSLSTQSHSSLSGLSLTCPHSHMSGVTWIHFLRRFQKVNGLTDSCVAFDEQCTTLLSLLHLVAGLKEVGMTVNILSQSWATRTLHLMHSCPSLQAIRLTAGVEAKGLLLEEGIKILQESDRDPGCTLTLNGWRCHKAFEQCTGEGDWSRDCNQRVQLQLCGQTCTEKCLN